MGQVNFVWWNLGNFFDTDDDPISRDFGYTPANGWTQEVFEAKKANLAAALDKTFGTAGVDLLAVAEIEKDSLLQALTDQMPGSSLQVVVDEHGTSDLRGIDVAMAFNPAKLTPIAQQTHLIHLRYRTRDVFEVTFRVNETGEEVVVIACHWPSRVRGKYETAPLRIAVAEHVAFLVEGQVKVSPQEYENLRAAGDLAAVQRRWERKVMIAGDFNDEPFDRSVVDHLRASNEKERVVGETNDIDKFEDETADYRSEEVFLFNPTWKLLRRRWPGTYFIAGTRSGIKFTNRYQVLDQIVASRGLVAGNGLTLDVDSVAVFDDESVATRSRRPRSFSWSRMTGTSDHLPLKAVLRY